MANDLLKKLEEKINEAIETIELSRMEVSDLKEQNEELENRYSDWETRLSTLIEKFEQLEDVEDTKFEEEVNSDGEPSLQDVEEEIKDADTINIEDAEESEAADAAAFDSEDEEAEGDSDEEELEPTFASSSESLNEAQESVHHPA